jgi:hypothetical protein
MGSSKKIPKMPESPPPTVTTPITRMEDTVSTKKTLLSSANRKRGLSSTIKSDNTEIKGTVLGGQQNLGNQT